MEKSYIIKKLFNDYTKQFLPKILLSAFFSVCVAASTSAIAWLLDPAIEKIFIEKDKTLLLVIPIAIIVAFTVKGFSLYFARVIFNEYKCHLIELPNWLYRRSEYSAGNEIIDGKGNNDYWRKFSLNAIKEKYTKLWEEKCGLS